MSNPLTGTSRSSQMNTQFKLKTIDELVEAIYEDNLDHFDFHENMGGEDCDCHIHTTIKTIVQYWSE